MSEHKPCHSLGEDICTECKGYEPWPCRDFLQAALAAAEARAAAAEQRADAAVAALERLRAYHGWTVDAYARVYGEPTDDEPSRVIERVLAAQQGAEGQDSGPFRHRGKVDVTITRRGPLPPLADDAAPTAAPGATED